jgi:hypothetical protein
MFPSVKVVVDNDLTTVRTKRYRTQVQVLNGRRAQR